MGQKDLLNLDIAVTGKEMNYELAKLLSEDLAESVIDAPMLIAWYDGIQQQEHPEVPECQHKPGWIAYAQGHGGKIRINVNGNQFSFIYADTNQS